MMHILYIFKTSATKKVFIIYNFLTLQLTNHEIRLVTNYRKMKLKDCAKNLYIFVYSNTSRPIQFI